MSMMSQFITESQSNNFRLLFVGNSWTYGTGSSGGQTFPKQTYDQLVALGNTVTYLNDGIPGQSIDNMNTNASAIDAQLGNYDILIVTELVNQWGSNLDETKEVVLEKYKQYCLDRIVAGWSIENGKRVIATTAIDQAHYTRTGWTEAKAYFIETMLATFPSVGILVANVGGDSRMSNCLDLTYYNIDEIHPRSIGYKAFADVLVPIIL